MIFRQVKEILSGQKTQTRRECKSGEYMVWDSDRHRNCVEANGRIKWEIGRNYAVVPKRGEMSVFYNPQTLEIWPGDGFGVTIQRKKKAAIRAGYVPLRIQITGLYCLPLHNITEEDALAEGVGSVAEYKELWEQINGNGSWDKNPMVWEIAFERVIYKAM